MTVEERPLVFTMETELVSLLRLGGLVQEGIRVTAGRSETLRVAIREAEEEVRGLYAGLPPSRIPGLGSARRLFRSIGVDPTRMRPASEALVRRTLRGTGLPEINSAVDAANLFSLRFMVPVGLYDRDRIRGAVQVRLGREGEAYARIGRGELHLEGRLGLFDAEGGFGNPTGDSRRTAVTEETKNLLFVVFFPADRAFAEIRDLVQEAARILERFAGGRARFLGEGGVIQGEGAG